MNKKVLLILPFMLAGSLPAYALEQVNIRFSHVVSPKSPKGLAADYFKKKLEESSTPDIKFKVTVYPNSQLFKDKEETEAVQNGNVEMIAPAIAKMTPLGFPSFDLFDLPYLFDNEKDVHKITEGEIGKKMLNSLSSKGLLGLSFWDNGFKQFSSNRPLKSVEAFKNQKFRTMPSQVLVSQMRALGAKAVPLAFSETYNALSVGIADGAENPTSNFYTQRFYEVQKYQTMTNHGYLGYIVVMNKKFYDGLSKDAQSILNRVSSETTTYANKVALEQNEADLAKVKTNGDAEIVYITQAEKNSLKSVLQIPIQKENAEKIGVEILQSINKELGNKEAYEALQQLKK